MAALQEMGAEVEPVYSVPDSYPIPPEQQNNIDNFVAVFDRFFRPESAYASQSNKEMHGVSIRHKYGEVVKYQNDSGDIVRSLEIIRSSWATITKIDVLSILEQSDGSKRVNFETCTKRTQQNGNVLIIPGIKRDLETLDYAFIEISTRWLDSPYVRLPKSALLTS